MSMVNHVYQVKLKRTVKPAPGKKAVVFTSSIVVDVWNLPGLPSKQEIGLEAEKNLGNNHGFKWIKVRKKT